MESSTLSFKHPSYKGIIGAARVDITPPIGIYAKNWGAANHDTMEGIHRPLTATALTICEEGDEPLVLLSLDLGWWRRRKDEWALRRSLLEALQLNAARVIINFTHTHAGPAICPDDADRPGGELINPYLELLSDRVISVTREALESAEPAYLEWGTGRCSLAQNRDFPDPDSDRILCGYNPSGLSPDDTLLVGRVTTIAGKPLAVIVNYACHPTTLAYDNRLISPDFPGAMREIVEEQTSALCLTLQGASGELAPREQYTADTSIADRHGRELGYAVLSTLEGMLPPASTFEFSGTRESGALLGVWNYISSDQSHRLEAVQDQIELAIQSLPTAIQLKNEMDACEDPVIRERLNRKLRIREGIGTGDTTTMPYWVWQVGDAIILGHPNEAYSHLQVELRRAFPDIPVVVMNCANGHFGYLPPANLYSENIYPVWQTPFAAGCLERMIERCIDSIEQIRSMQESPRNYSE